MASPADGPPMLLVSTVTSIGKSYWPETYTPMIGSPSSPESIGTCTTCVAAVPHELHLDGFAGLVGLDDLGELIGLVELTVDRQDHVAQFEHVVGRPRRRPPARRRRRRWARRTPGLEGEALRGELRRAPASDSARTSSGSSPPVNCASLKRSMSGSIDACSHSTRSRALSRTNSNMISPSVGYDSAPSTEMRAGRHRRRRASSPRCRARSCSRAGVSPSR